MEALRPTDPRRLGEYELVGRLGVGGQGVVYLGRAAADRPVAIKLLHPGLTEDAEVKARFLREAAAAQQVARFCTAQILDVNLDDDQPYVVSEYVPGPSLRRLVAEQGPVRGADLDRLAIGMATALTAIHRAGIVHRDFKPANVLVGPDGPRVIDFGIARALDVTATQTGGRPVGTPSYMSPEQLDGKTADPAMDVFAFGATLVFAATGAPPFGQDTIPAVVARILHRDPELGAMDGTLRETAMACLAKDPADRPTAQEILLLLLGHGPARADNPLVMLNAGSAAAADQDRTRSDPRPVPPAKSPLAAYSAADFAAHPGSTAPPGPGGATQTGARSGARKRAIILAAAVVIALLAVGIPLGIQVQNHRTPTASAAGPGAAPSAAQSGDAPSVNSKSSKPQRATGAPASASPSSTPTRSSSPRPTRSTPTVPGTPTKEPVYGTLESERGGVELGSGWTTQTFRIMATGGPVHYTATTGPDISAPSSGTLAADTPGTITVTKNSDAPATGSSSVTLQGEKNSITIQLHWG
jgi:serine/threonine protein kinase